MKLSPHMRATLEKANRGALRRTSQPGPGAGGWPASPTTLHALVRHQLLELGEGRNRHGWRMTTWTITDLGRQALEPVSRRRTTGVRYLTDRNRHPELDDYTSDPRFAIKGEPEAIEPSAITPISAIRHIQVKREEHLRKQARMAAQSTREFMVWAHRQGLSDELDAVLEFVAGLNRKRRAA